MSITEEDVSRFLGQSLQDLNQSVDESDRQWRPAMVRHQGGAVSQRKSTRPDFDTILDRSHLEDKPAIKVFAQALVKDGRYSDIIERLAEAKPGLFSYYSLQPGHIAINTLKEYLWKVNSLAFDEEVAQEVSKDFIDSLDSQRGLYVDFTVLRGLRGELTSHQLPGGFVLRGVGDEELSELVERYPRLLEEDNLPQNVCILERRIEFLLGTEPPRITDSHHSFKEIITALRVLKEGEVDYQNSFRRNTHPGQVGFWPMSAHDMNTRHAPVETFPLSPSEMDLLIVILQAIQKPCKSNKLRIAVDRLSRAVQRMGHSKAETAEDRLLDLIICLEALHGDGEGAARYKIALRTALLVGSNHEERKEIFMIVQEAYNIRSALVHGGSKNRKKNKMEREGVVNKLSDIARRSLLSYLEAVASNQKIPRPEDLDDAILQSFPLGRSN